MDGALEGDGVAERAGRGGRVDHQMGVGAEDLVAKVRLESVHHAEHDDECPQADRHADDADEGRQRHGAALLHEGVGRREARAEYEAVEAHEREDGAEAEGREANGGRERRAHGLGQRVPRGGQAEDAEGGEEGEADAQMDDLHA